MAHIFHVATGMGGMIAWNASRTHAILIDQTHFRSLVNELLEEFGDERLMFSAGVVSHLKLVDDEVNKKCHKLLHTRLLNLLQKGQVQFDYQYEHKEAQKRLEDFLEVYKYSHGHASYTMGNLHDQSDVIVNIALRHKANIAQRLSGRLGKIYGEINIMLSELEKVEGSSSDFRITLKSDKSYRFNERGVEGIGQ